MTLVLYKNNCMYCKVTCLRLCCVANCSVSQRCDLPLLLAVGVLTPHIKAAAGQTSARFHHQIHCAGVQAC
jgi:hypothetical protein